MCCSICILIYGYYNINTLNINVIDSNIEQHKDTIDLMDIDIYNIDKKQITELHNMNMNSQYPPIPSIISIGPEKSGTTSFGQILNNFSEFVIPFKSPINIGLEIRIWLNCGHMFDLNSTFYNMLNSMNHFKSKCSLKWYKHFWSVPYNDIRNEYKSDTIKYKYYYYFEKSPAYWYYEHMAFLFKHFLPYNTKYVILLRNPFKRMYSYFILQYLLNRVITIDFNDFIQQSLNNKYIQSMMQILSLPINNKKNKLISLWRLYIYKNQQNYITVNGNYEYDTNPWFSLGANCYVVPLLMWLKYIPITQIKLIQTELLFNKKSNVSYYFNLFRCWLSMQYEYDNNLEICLKDKQKWTDNNITMIHSRKVSQFASSIKDKLILTETVRFEYNNFITSCNQRLSNLLNENKYIELQLMPFQWELWN
eukprot:89767_1